MAELLHLAGRPLLFVCKQAQWDRLRDLSSLPAGYVVASADFDLTHTLRTNGVEVIDLFQFATEQQGRESVDQAWSIADALRSNPPVAANLPGCNLLERTANELVSPWSEVFFQGALIEACLARYKPVRIYSFPEVSQSYEWDYPADQPPDVFNATVMHWAGVRGIPHCFVDAPVGGTNYEPAAPTAALPLPDRALSGYGPLDGGTICFAPKFAALGEMRVLIHAVRTGGQANWLIVTDSDDSLGLPTLRQELLLSLPFDLTEWKFDADAVNRSVLLACSVGRLDDRVERVISDPSFAFIWERYCAELSAWARWFAAARFLAASTPPSAVVVGYDALAFNRAIEAGFAAANVPSLSIDHVGCGVDASHRRNICGQAHVAVWGDADRKGQERWRGVKWKAIEIGTLRGDHAFLADRLGEPPERSVVIPTAQHRHERPRIVLLTSKFTSSRSITGPIDAFERSWKGLLAMIEKRSDWDFVLKPHPAYDHHALYASSVFQLPNLEVVSGTANQGRGRAQKILETAAVTVLVNCPTTTAIDAVGLGVPVLYLKDASWPGSASPLEGGLAKCVDSPEQLETEIERLLSDASYRGAFLLSSGSALSRLVVAAGQSAVDRALSAIEAIRAPGAKAKARSNFGADLLELMISDIGSPGSFLRWTLQFRARWVDANEGSLQMRELGLAGPAELKLWLWRLVIERCRRTSSTARAFVFFSIAALLLPVPLRLRSNEISAHWLLAKLK